MVPHGWFLLTGIRVPQLLTLHERRAVQLFYMHYREAMHVKHAAPIETHIVKE